MPCTCKQKVDRGQPKIQCSKCKELFHLKCANLSEADADFFVKFEREFLCAVCTKLRRNSIRSPPPPRNTPDALPPVDDLDIVIVPEKQQGPSAPPVSQKVNNSQQKDKEMESALIAVVQELAGLRAENVRVLSLLQSLYDDKQMLLGKVDNLQSELLSMKRLFNNCFSAVNPEAVNVPICADAKTSCISRAANTTNSMSTTVSTISAANSYTSNAAADASAAISYAAAASASETLSPSVVPFIRNRSPLLLRPIVASGVDAPSVNAPIDSAWVSVESKRKKRMTTTPTSASTASISYAAAAAAPAMPTSRAPTSNRAQLEEPAQLAMTDGSIDRSRELKTVTRANKKKIKQPLVIGSNQNKELSVVPNMKWLHISSFSNTVTVADIVDYVEKHAEIDREFLSCYMLIKKDAPVKDFRKINFKLGVAECFYDKLLNADIWPTNVKIRPFTFFQKDVTPPLIP